MLLKIDGSFSENPEEEGGYPEEEDQFETFATEGKPSWAYPNDPCFHHHAYSFSELSNLNYHLDGLGQNSFDESWYLQVSSYTHPLYSL